MLLRICQRPSSGLDLEGLGWARLFSLRRPGGTSRHWSKQNRILEPTSEQTPPLGGLASPRLASSPAPYTAIWQPQIHGICSHMREIASELCSGLCQWLLSSNRAYTEGWGARKKPRWSLLALRGKVQVFASYCLLRQVGNN